VPGDGDTSDTGNPVDTDVPDAYTNDTSDPD
jgi:hypothetical protein